MPMRDRMTVNQMIEVLQAYRDGKQIEYRSSIEAETKWFDLNTPKFAFDIMEYRIKKVPLTMYAVFNKYGILLASWTDESSARHYAHKCRPDWEAYVVPMQEIVSV